MNEWGLKWLETSELEAKDGREKSKSTAVRFAHNMSLKALATVATESSTSLRQRGASVSRCACVYVNVFV
jgi:hypothetical protein